MMMMITLLSLCCLTLFGGQVSGHHLITASNYVYAPTFAALTDIHRHRQHDELCPPEEVFAPCTCSLVSFDGEKYYSQITCTGVTGRDLKNVFHNAAHRNHPNITQTFDILELKDTPRLSFCCENMFEGFKFRTIKLTDSVLCVLHRDALIGTVPTLKEWVMVSTDLTSNLVDGEQLFAVLRSVPNLTGIFIITSNLRYLPKGALRSPAYAHSLEVVRICNTQIDRIPDYAFHDLPALVWIDFGDNKINQLSPSTFLLASPSGAALQINLAGNRLSEHSIPPGTFLGTHRTKVTLHIMHNLLTTLREDVFDQLIRGGNYVIDVDENPFTCDCRLRWLFYHREDNAHHLKNLNCAIDHEAIWTKDLPRTCDAQPRIVKLIKSPGPLYKKCCSKINYNLEREHRQHEHKHVQVSPVKVVRIDPHYHDHDHDHHPVSVVIERPVVKEKVTQVKVVKTLPLHSADAFPLINHDLYHHHYHQDKK